MRLAYGTRTIQVPAFVTRRATVLRPHVPRPLPFSSLHRPLRPIARWARSGRRILVVVPDGTRYAAAEHVLPLLRTLLRADGVPDSSVEVLFANGLHPPPSPAQRKVLVGPEIARAWSLHGHDARLGCSSMGRLEGVPIEISRRVLAADRLILLTAAGFHYLAGFGGGWKMLLPGCASERTILALHRHTLQDGAEIGRLDGNPFRRAIDSAGKLVPIPARSIHLVLDPSHRLLAFDSGPPTDSLRRISRKVLRLFRVPLARPVDVTLVSTGGHPKDCDLIQTHKAIDNASRALRPGGSMIVLAECPQGLGHPNFEQWFQFSSPDRLRAFLEKRFHPYGRTAWALWTKARRFRIILVSSLPADLVRRLRLEPATDLNEALRKIDPPRRFLLLPDAGWTLPEVRTRS